MIYEWLDNDDNMELIKDWFKTTDLLFFSNYHSTFNRQDNHNSPAIILNIFKKNDKSISYAIIIEDDSIRYTDELKPILDNLKPYILSCIRDQKIDDIMKKDSN